MSATIEEIIAAINAAIEFNFRIERKSLHSFATKPSPLATLIFLAFGSFSGIESPGVARRARTESRESFAGSPSPSAELVSLLG